MLMVDDTSVVWLDEDDVVRFIFGRDDLGSFLYLFVVILVVVVFDIRGLVGGQSEMMTTFSCCCVNKKLFCEF